MKKTMIIIALWGFGMSLCAQETDSIATAKKSNAFTRAMTDAADAVVKWDTETMLDSLDQEDLPKLVTGGVLAGWNMSDFLITRDHHTMASHRRHGAEIGGFLDFTITKHFAIQPQVLFSAHQNYFSAEDDTVRFANDRLWSFGMEIPVYFMGRFGNMKTGYVQFGGGIFTHFTFASNKGKYNNVDKPTKTVEDDGFDYDRLYKLHNNHFGLCAMVGYEFGFGLMFNVSYKISLSDIAGFYDEMKGQEIADALIYPHSLSICVGYRIK